MKKIIYSLMAMIILGSFGDMEAQVIGNYIKKKANKATNRAEKKADERVDQEINKAVDKEVDKVFDQIFNSEEEEKEKSEENTGESSVDEQENSSSSSRNNAASRALMKSMGINTAPANVNDNYDYQGNIIMNVQTWDEDENTEGEVVYTTYMTDDNSGFAMEFMQPERGNSTMIFDYKNEKMIILSQEDGQKTGIVMDYSGFYSDSLEEETLTEEEIDEAAATDFTVYNENLKKTGRSKNIAGYKCDEYTYNDEEDDITLWMTDELPAELWANMFSANTITASSVGYYGGFVMEMDQKDKVSGERTYLIVKEVNKNQSKTIPTSGYQLMSFGASGKPKDLEEKEE